MPAPLLLAPLCPLRLAPFPSRRRALSRHACQGRWRLALWRLSREIATASVGERGGRGASRFGESAGNIKKGVTRENQQIELRVKANA